MGALAGSKQSAQAAVLRRGRELPRERRGQGLRGQARRRRLVAGPLPAGHGRQAVVLERLHEGADPIGRLGVADDVVQVARPLPRADGPHGVHRLDPRVEPFGPRAAEGVRKLGQELVHLVQGSDGGRAQVGVGHSHALLPVVGVRVGDEVAGVRHVEDEVVLVVLAGRALKHDAGPWRVGAVPVRRAVDRVVHEDAQAGNQFRNRAALGHARPALCARLLEVQAKRGSLGSHRDALLVDHPVVLVVLRV
mmetsp:Transcript_33901/g.91774  ORF Transcript_33901/g.91774 Transcript_33901/m.91774 type:complete len:250 (+) Transcript_33901:531-1280(+)